MKFGRKLMSVASAVGNCLYTLNMCIIEGRELICSNHECLSKVTEGIKSIYVSEYPDLSYLANKQFGSIVND